MSDPAASIAKINAMADVFFRLSKAFDSDDEDDEDDVSTDEGITDDSENESFGTASDTQEDECFTESWENLCHRTGKAIGKAFANELPPGTPLPANFRPPPGLSLTLEDGLPW